MRTTMTAHDQQEPGNALASPARARARLGRALLGYLLGGIGVVTLMPLRFQWPSHLPDLWQTNWFDIGANICLFVPLGFVYRLGSTAPGSPARLQAWCFGAAVSLGLELTQLFLPGRYPCLSDVLANSLGMWLGATVHDGSVRYVRRRLLGQLALELPLMTLFYLFLPVLWLSGLATGTDHARLGLSLLLGVCGGSLLVAVWRHRLRPAGVLSAPRVILLVAGWFMTGACPGFPPDLRVLVLGSLAVGCGAWLLTGLAGGRPRQDRRFEWPTLRVVGCCYLTYLVLLALWPWPWSPQPWHGSLGFADLADTPGVLPMLRLLEYLAAFTLLGYMVAEARGRRVASVRQTLCGLCLVSLGSGSVLEGIRGFHPQHTASLAQLLLLTGAGLYGGCLYRLQLATVQLLLRQPQPPDPCRG